MMHKKNSLLRQHSIAIIGAGYSGTLTAINILRGNAPVGVQLFLVERQAPFGRGLAYRTWDDNLLLNVPAGNMSAIADDSDHFVAYCRTIDPAFNASSFISRRIYGDYLEQTLSQAEKESVTTLQRVNGEAIAVRPQAAPGKLMVELSNGKKIVADQVVLALGHFLPRIPSPESSFFSSDAFVGNPWDFAAIDRIDHEHSVALLGAGHTAIDTLFRLTSSSNTRKIFLVSRRGLLSHGHRLAHNPPVHAGFPRYLENIPCTVRAHIGALRKEVKRREAAGGDWRDVVNELRPHTPAIWSRFSLIERRKFLSRAAAYWDIHRHRLAPSAHLRLKRMLDSGQVEIVAGHIQAYAKNGNEVNVSVQMRHGGKLKELTVGAVINCTGPNYDISTLKSPLVAQLRDEGFLRQDPLKLGLEVNEKYQLINHQGLPAINMFYMGPMLKAKYWEAIAIPELRVHSLCLAKKILSEINAGLPIR